MVVYGPQRPGKKQELTAAGRKSRDLHIIRNKEEQLGNRPKFNAGRSAKHVTHHGRKLDKPRPLSDEIKIVEAARKYKGNYIGLLADTSIPERIREAFFYH